MHLLHIEFETYEVVYLSSLNHRYRPVYLLDTSAGFIGYTDEGIVQLGALSGLTIKTYDAQLRSVLESASNRMESRVIDKSMTVEA